MKALCTGDWHAGVPALDLAEQEKVWHRVVDAAIENRVDLFLHGGDLFEGPLTTPEQMRAVLNPFARLRHAQIPVIVLLGNGRHDLAARRLHGLDVLRDIPGIRVSDRPENIEVAGCVVSTLPWTKRAREEDTAAQLVAIARGLHEEANGDPPNVLLAHWSISSGSLPNGLPLTELREPVLEWADLDAIGFECVIASHIHKAQRLDDPRLGDATPGLYVGSPQPLNHGEAGYEHGVWIVDVEPGKVSTDFLLLASPRFVTVDWAATEEGHVWGFTLGDPVRERADGWADFELIGQDDIVRVRYTATREQDATIDKEAIRRELLAAGASRVTIESTIIREARARVETMTQELGPLDALGMYADAQGLDDATKGRMLERLREWVA